jgi:hypothetical protein
MDPFGYWGVLKAQRIPLISFGTQVGAVIGFHAMSSRVVGHSRAMRRGRQSGMRKAVSVCPLGIAAVLANVTTAPERVVSGSKRG